MVKSKQDRRQRVPFGVARRKMTLDSATEKSLRSDNKIPRWINDSEDRLIQAQNGGYEFVTANGTELVGEGKELQERDRMIRKLVGKNPDGSGKYSYLMAIPKEFYEEDQKRKEEHNNLVDLAIKGGQPNGLPHHGISPDKGQTYVKNIDYQP
jgi:hypothetical protein